MYPFFNADYHERTAQDKVWVNLMRPTEGLERGMIVAFWYVVVLELWKAEGGGFWLMMAMNDYEYRSPSNPERMGVKRIIALEGDDVVTRRPYPVAREDVPVGHVWVEGDQRDPDKAYDSNWLGPVSFSFLLIFFFGKWNMAFS